MVIFSTSFSATSLATPSPIRMLDSSTLRLVQFFNWLLNAIPCTCYKNSHESFQFLGGLTNHNSLGQHASCYLVRNCSLVILTSALRKQYLKPDCKISLQAVKVVAATLNLPLAAPATRRRVSASVSKESSGRTAITVPITGFWSSTKQGLR